MRCYRNTERPWWGKDYIAGVGECRIVGPLFIVLDEPSRVSALVRRIVWAVACAIGSELMRISEWWRRKEERRTQRDTN